MHEEDAYVVINYLPNDRTRLYLLFWHAPLGVRSAIRRHQPPQKTVLGQGPDFQNFLRFS